MTDSGTGIRSWVSGGYESPFWALELDAGKIDLFA